MCRPVAARAAPSPVERPVTMMTVLRGVAAQRAVTTMTYDNAVFSCKTPPPYTLSSNMHLAWLPKPLASVKRYDTSMDVSFLSAMSLDLSISTTISGTQTHSNCSDRSQKLMGGARARTPVCKAAFRKFIIGFDTRLLRND